MARRGSVMPPLKLPPLQMCGAETPCLSDHRADIRFIGQTIIDHMRESHGSPRQTKFAESHIATKLLANILTRENILRKIKRDCVSNRINLMTLRKK